MALAPPASLCQAIDPAAGIDSALDTVNSIGAPNNLSSSLQQALNFLNAGQLSQARNQLLNFIRDLQTAVNNGQVSVSDGNVLLDQASAILASVDFE